MNMEGKEINHRRERWQNPSAPGIGVAALVSALTSSSETGRKSFQNTSNMLIFKG
ncbi:hypothetical protein [Oceaniglobus ichthyenteri]|uniref:hypothetical protein n=1 Tax=Oceaniglobus ichthyenteri TaxID=2136177 RepID=UPI0013DE4822|nr:hypothetical protein [Oceaniglobus ichthyenteri]